MIINKKGKERLIYVWCYLDNMFGRLEKLMEKEKSNAKLFGYLAEQITAVDTMRHNLMQVFGYNDYDLFVKEVVSKYATFKNNWSIKNPSVLMEVV